MSLYIYIYTIHYIYMCVCRERERDGGLGILNNGNRRAWDSSCFRTSPLLLFRASGRWIMKLQGKPYREAQQ